MLSTECLLSHVIHVRLKVSQPEAVLVVLSCSCLNETCLCESRLPGQRRGKKVKKHLTKSRMCFYPFNFIFLCPPGALAPERRL